MFEKFRDKVIIITGASSGIGLATVKEFASAGSKVVMAARSSEKLDLIAAEIKAAGGEVFPVVTDVSIEEDCKRLIDKTIEKYGRIDILVNNAGISMRALFIETDIQVLKKVMDVNFWGTVYCTKFALPYLLLSHGSLVGVSSVAGFHGMPARSGYSASKFAMHGFLESVRIENLKKNLHVMIIAPGFTASEVRVNALTADGTPQGVSPREEKKMMQPEYVARWILKGIVKKKRNKLLTMDGRLTALFQRISPLLIDKIFFSELSKEPDSPLLRAK